MIVEGIDKNRVVQYVVDTYDSLKNARTDKELTWLECMQAYLCHFPEVWADAQLAGRSVRFFGISNDAVNTVHSQLLAMIFPRDKWLHLEPMVPGGLPSDDEAAEEISQLLEMQRRSSRFEKALSPGLLQLLITGNCPWMVGWRMEHAINYPAYASRMEEWTKQNQQRFVEYLKARQEWEAVKNEAIAAGQEPPEIPEYLIPEPPPANPEIAYMGPTLEICDVFDTVLDHNSPDPRRALRIRKHVVSLQTLRSMAQPNPATGYSAYSNVENIAEVDHLQDEDSHFMLRQQAFGLNPVERRGVVLKTAMGTMEIPMENESGSSVYVSYIASVANDNTLVRMEPTFLWSGDLPLQWATYQDVPGQVYGVGILENVLGLQDLINVRTNQMVDAAAFTINPEYKFVPDGLIPAKQQSAPGRGVKMRDINNFEILQKDFRGIQLAQAEINQLVSEFRGMTRSLSPLAGSKQTATKDALDANVIGTDLGQRASHIEEDFVSRALDLYIQLSAQYLDDAAVSNYLQKRHPRLSRISPEKVRAGWIVKATGSQHFIDRREQVQNLFMYAQLGLGNQLTAPAIRIVPFMKKMYRLLGFSDEDDIIRDADTAQQVFDYMLMSGMLGGNGGAGNQGPIGAAAATSASDHDGAPGGGGGEGPALGRDNRGIQADGSVAPGGRTGRPNDQGPR